MRGWIYLQLAVDRKVACLIPFPRPLYTDLSHDG
jgi:hypothetical protein